MLHSGRGLFGLFLTMDRRDEEKKRRREEERLRLPSTESGKSAPRKGQARDGVL
jgi:hypothetical protein